MRRITIIAASALVLLAVASPVSANDTIRWTDTRDIDNVFTCGVVEETVATIEGTAYFAADGTWLKDILRFSYAASYTDPATGATISFRIRQIIGASPENIVLRAQGTFVRAGGSGAVSLDVGRLVIDPADGSTIFKSAKAITFDDPTVMDRYDTAICSLFD